MSAHEPEMPTDIEVTGGLWKQMPIIGAVLGVAGLGAAFSQLGANKTYVVHSYLFAYMTVLSVALGCLAFVLIQHLVRAGWSTAVRRIPENAAGTLWLFALLALPIIIFAHDLFPWTHEEHLDAILKHKKPYLNVTFFNVRAAIYVVVWVGLGWFVRARSIAMDKGGDVKPHVRALRIIAPIGMILYAFTQTFASFDWMMSLQPHWYSTMFGVYYFAGSMLGAYSFMALVFMSLQKGGYVKTAVTTEHFHDLGKFIFGHTIFWAYIAFSQFMLIWYANIPEEVEFYYHRLHPEHGWAAISYALPLMNFFIPFFFLLSRHVKRSRTGLAVGAIYAMFVHIIDIYWLVLAAPELKAHFPDGRMWMDVAAVVGVFGLFLAAFAFNLTRAKLVPVGDPRLKESLAHENF